jgi:hypothetical protein
MAAVRNPPDGAVARASAAREIDMRKVLLAGLVVGFGGLGAVPAMATGGGMGDPSQHLKDMNAICQMQRHGVGPLSPNLCLDDYPVASVDHRRPQSSY